MTLFALASPTTSEWWMLATASVCGAACALCGCYLVLRKMSLLGDAITHAILPGLAGAFLLTGTRNVAAMLAGAMVVGLLTAGLSSWLTRRVKVAGDAALGAVFTTMFAIGVILISQAASGVDLDPGCVLYGLLEFVGVDTVRVLGLEVPRAILPLACALGVLIAVVAALGRPLTLVCFDATLAATIGGLGAGAAVLHGLAVALIAATSVVSFEAVGSILVVAMLVGPAAAARLWTDRLGVMLLLSVALGVLSALLGGLAALAANVSAAGAIACAVGVVFTVSILCAPRHGAIVGLARRWLLTLRVHEEDVLGELYRKHEAKGTAIAEPPASHPMSPSLGHALWRSLAWRRLRAAGYVAGETLTPAGERRAASLLRAHRLWETYLAKDLNLALDHLHAPAERTEHFISEQLANALDAAVDATTDPQGKPIPRVSDRGS